jgi:death-on-curing protein
VITAHLFEDGNKRTAWTTTILYLDTIGDAPAETGDRVPHILRRIRRYDVDELAEWLETGNIDEDRLDP